jgi:hypothetical protein
MKCSAACCATRISAPNVTPFVYVCRWSGSDLNTMRHGSAANNHRFANERTCQSRNRQSWLPLGLYWKAECDLDTARWQGQLMPPPRCLGSSRAPVQGSQPTLTDVDRTDSEHGTKLRCRRQRTSQGRIVVRLGSAATSKCSTNDDRVLSTFMSELQVTARAMAAR